MKTLLTIYTLIIALLLCSGCEENVETPSPDFYIEVTDPDEGIVKLQEPYEVKVGQTFNVVANNTADFNTFWPGDILYSDEDTIIQIYDENLTIQHRGVKLGDENITDYAYGKPGSYNFTFVSVNVNAGASTMETATKSGTITVSE